MATTARADVVWRYLPGHRVRHALVRTLDADGHDPQSLCGTWPMWSPSPDWDWRGTGSQVEYETVEGLRECRRCAALVGTEEVARDGAA